MADEEIVINKIIVPIAFTSGFKEVRIIPKTNVGKVLPAPIVKKVIIKSSTERATASNEAPITTGCIIGIVIVKKAFKPSYLPFSDRTQKRRYKCLGH